jgi:hypothetical protein
MAIKERRASKQTHSLPPVSDNDTYFTPEMIQRVKDGQQEVREGKSTIISSKDELNTFFDNL